MPEGILIESGVPLDAFGLIWKKEETLELIRKENGSEDPVKSRISNRPLSVDSGTWLRGGLKTADPGPLRTRFRRLKPHS